MRLLRARALLVESTATVASVAAQAGFPSISQFYEHFGRAYGVTPQAMREGQKAPD
jgi:transcriptional regulator GlxA family with amidase domain